MSNAALKGLLIGVLSAIPSGAARAADDAFSLFEEEAKVISATKHLQSARGAPASVHIISNEEIRNSGYRTLTEALGTVPGFYGFSDRNYNYLWVRGFGRPGDYNSRILLLLDGHRLNDNIYGQVFPDRGLIVDMRSVERIEVVSGPGSALHGDNAFFAVVNVITRRPKTSGTSAAISSGGFGERGAFGDAALRKGELGLYAAAAVTQSRGRDHHYSQFATNGGVAVDADREESHSEYASLELGKFRLHAGSNRRAKRVPTAPYSSRFNDNGTHTVDWRRFIEGGGEVALPRDVTVNARVYYDWYGYYGNYLYDAAAPPPGTTVNRDETDNAWWGTEVRARWTGLGEASALTVGGEFERNVQAFMTNYDQEPFKHTFANDTRESRHAIFIQQELRPREPLAITAGGRYDHYQAFGHTLNPRLAGVYTLSDSHFFKALYGSAFRAPNINERFYSGPTISVNPNLRPEAIQTYELSYDYRHNAGNSLRLSFLHSRVKDLISQVLDAQGRQQYVNKERLRTDAVEASGHWALDAWSGRLAYMLQSTREEGGDRLSNSPTHVGSAGILHRWGRAASLGARVQALSRRRTVRGSTLPAVGLVDLDARFQPWTRGPVVTVALRNAFDANYAHSGAGEHVQDALRQDGRSFFAGLEYSFGH